MNDLKAVAGWLFLGTALVGFGLALLFWLFRSFAAWSVRHAGTTPAKVLSELIQFFAAAFGLYFAYRLGPAKAEWLPVAIRAGVAVLAWELAQIAIDSRAQRELRQAEAAADLLSRLCEGLSGGARLRLRTIAAALRSAGQRVTIHHAREALDPAEQLAALLDTASRPPDPVSLLFCTAASEVI